MNKRSKFDVPHEAECPRCSGIGYTEAEAPQARMDEEGKYRTTKLGSGCSLCGGTGRWSGYIITVGE